MIGDPAEMFARGAQALEAQDLGSAEQWFRGILAQNPRAHAAWNALSVVTLRGGVPDIALEHVQRALALDRRNPVYLNNLGVAYGELGRFGEAEDAFRRALKAKPVYAEALFNLGKVLHKQDRPAEALKAFERAHAIDAKFPGLRAYLAHMYRKQGAPRLAMDVLRAVPSKSMERDHVPVYAECLAEAEGEARALEWLREQLARDPQWHALRLNLAYLLLSTGEWRSGWTEYQHRYADTRQAPPLTPLPGELRQRRIEVAEEQGLGDTLFFLRFVPELRRRGARVALVCPPKLRGVIATGTAVDELVHQAGADALLCGDLPALLGVEHAPAPFPLVPVPERVVGQRAALAALGPGPYLALTWRAGTDVLRNQEFGGNRLALMKEVPLQALAEALRGWRGTVLVLQRAPKPEEMKRLQEALQAPVHDLSPLNEDLPQMLALLSVVDEYVAVSNTNVHLVAGLGKTCRVLVPYPPEWRWMRTEGESAWFPGFPAYREPPSRGWDAPLARLRRDLVR